MSERRLLLRALPAGLAVLFVLSLLPTPAAAEPGVPYCQGSADPVGGVARGVIMPDVCEAVTGRVFPEASPNSIAGSPNALPGASTKPVDDYISYFEFKAGLDYLAASEFGQKYLTVHEVAQSVGLCATPAPSVPLVGSGGDCPTPRNRFPIYMLELTNKESTFPMENRQSMLFMLSIHGNEKGGREGGFRVLEDLVKGIGFAAETVQGGAGMPTPIEKPTGGSVSTYHDYLDFMRVFLLFPNADGWAHDEAPYPATDPYCGTLFCRTNGNNTDLNRQAPTAGWQNPNRHVTGEPESIGYYNWMLQQDIDWSYAIDIHGMLNHQNFGAIMLPAGAMTPQEMQRSIRLAETLKTRLNDEANGHFAAWYTLFNTGETAEGPADDQCAQFDCPLPGSALSAAGSSQFAEYYTVIDAIGYTDSGFNGDYFAQDSGLNAPGYDIELAYNHITTDSQYAGAGSVFNDYHVKMVREIVKSFMDAAALDVKISFETRGLRTAYVEPSFVATSLDDTSPTPGGWADANPGDDLWDYGKNGGFSARPAQYWEDLKPFVRNGDQPGALVKTTAGTLTATQLEQFDQLVIPGSAIDDLETNPGAIAAIKAWVEAGGNLVLTDEALRFFDLSGLTTGAVDVLSQYMGGAGMDLSNPIFYEYQDNSNAMNRNVRGGVKQTYEPTPLGFETGANAAPNWFIDPAKFAALKGEVAGTACGTTQLSDRCPDNGIGIGKVKVGAGQIQFMGSLLPDPTEEFYHPYGLDPYATTYSGNQILRNMLYFGNVIDSPPVVLAGGDIVQSDNEPVAGPEAVSGSAPKDKDSPALGMLPLLGLVAVAALALRRRR
ncbi:MAG TPA: hypothetical protein VM327_00765 [Candidatus Thermoplasmatota archaeon]|nr:hypothetical protein [Candidatus Thermoplasmatota archaeon]